MPNDSSQPPKPNLPQHLLWEYDLEKFDYDRSWRIAIERVIERGNLEEWRETQAYFGKQRFVDVVEWSRQLTSRDKDFALLFINSKLLAPHN